MAIPTHTQRLRFEELSPDHSSLMFNLLLEPEIYDFILDRPPESAHSLKQHYESLCSGPGADDEERWLNWIVFRTESPRPIGYVQATINDKVASIAFVFSHYFWGKGYASEACRSLIMYLFSDVLLDRLTAEVHRENKRSLNLITRLGFSYHHRDATNNDLVFEITRDLWMSSRKKTDSQFAEDVI